MITSTLFERCFPTKGLRSASNLRKYNLIRERVTLIYWLNVLLPKYGINTYNRVVAFLSCCGVETDYFKTTCEYASGADYEGRRDLGNVLKGDGRKFKGSSLIQTTGRFNFYRVVVRFIKAMTGKDMSSKLAMTNFKKYLDSDDYKALIAEADRLGVNFLDHPELMRDNIKFAIEAACIFWQENDLNRFADVGQVKQLNGLVNRGSASKTPLHWDKRWALHLKLRQILPAKLTFDDVTPEPVVAPVTPTPEPTPAPEPVEPVETTPTEVQPIDLDKAQCGIDKCSATLQNPSIKTLTTRAGGRLGVGLGAIWGTTGGKIALILSGLVIAGVAGGLIYSYRKQIQLGYQIAKATVKKAIGGLF